MPRVPTYDSAVAESRPLPGTRESSVASPGLFGAGAEQIIEGGKSLLRAGSGLGDVVDRIQAEDNETEAKALDTEFANFGRDVLNGVEGDPATGYLSKQGKVAVDEYNSARDALLKKKQELLEKASNERVKMIVSRTFDQRVLGFRDTMDSHARTQRAAHMKATSELRVDSLANDMADYWANPTEHGKYLTALKNEAGALADMQGITEKRERDAFVQEFTTTGHARVIARMVSNGQASQAKTYFEQYGAEIGGKDRDRIAGIVREGALRVKAQEAVDSVMAKGLGLSGALSWVRKNYEGEEEDEIARRLKERYGEQESAAAIGRRQSADRAWKIITNGGGRDQIPADTWNALGGEEQKQIVDYLSRKGAGGADRDDISNLDAVETMIELGDITDRAQLARYEPYFTKSTLKTLANKIDKRGTVPPAELRRVFEERKGAKVNVGKMSEGERQEWMAFQDYILQNVRETKRPEDIDSWADRWFMQGRGRGDSWYADDPNTLGEARVKGRKDFVISTPEGARGEVDTALSVLQKNGVAIPKDRGLARDEFFTKHFLDAERWAGAHGVTNSPELAAAYAILKQNKKPITPANLDYIIQRLKK